ncbi:MAG: ferritin-like domain-containing protein, partial [Pirellulales bacterium]
ATVRNARVAPTKHSLADSPPSHSASAQWLGYFRRNADQLLESPWERGAQVTADEAAAIRGSIQGFQLGESSEGRHLIGCARRWAQMHGDPAYLDAIELFIKEEQRHARELGRFMDLADIPRVKKSWPDTVFRRLRHAADLEVSISVLVTAEIVSKVYYPALRAATRSSVLRAICDQIIHDETPHVQFQAERLRLLRRQCGPLALGLRHWLHRVLFWGTCWVVWYKHGRAMRAGGLQLGPYLRQCGGALAEALSEMDPRRA